MHRFSRTEGFGSTARKGIERDIERLANASRFLRDLGDGRLPGRMEIVTAPVLEEWMLGAIPAPVYMGRVAGHPSITDGAVAVTSPIIVAAEEDGWVRTLSRLYRLGQPMLPKP